MDMKVVYRYYQPSQGLEEIQAKIYTTVSGLPATAEEIRAQNMKKDPKTTRYALTADGVPLAYVSSRDSRSHVGRRYISYPWALPDCPVAVQERIFDDLLAYIKQRINPLEIATGVILESRTAEEQTEFFHRKGFVEKERVYRYCFDFDVNKVSRWEMPDDIRSYSNRLATIQDLDRLIEICRADPYMRSTFPTRESCRSYLKDKVLRDGHTVLVFQGEQAVAAGAILRLQPDGFFLSGDEQRTLMRFSAIHPGYPQAWKRLVIELAKECLAAGWTDIPLRVHFWFFTHAPLISTVACNLAQMRPEIETFEIILTYQDES